jgi:hypothetical protein
MALFPRLTKGSTRSAPFRALGSPAHANRKANEEGEAKIKNATRDAIRCIPSASLQAHPVGFLFLLIHVFQHRLCVRLTHDE